MEINFGLNRKGVQAYGIDDHSGPDNWKVGFEIIYRLIFHLYGKESDREKSDCLDKFKSVFYKVFELPENHYDLQGGNDENSVFWRIYWNTGPLDIRLLKRCENELNYVAMLNWINIEFVGMTIIPRSVSTISKKVDF